MKSVMQLDLPLQGHRQLLIGFSGGLDSTVLLHQLSALRPSQGLSLRAVYIHHGLSQYADEWLAHCQSICAQLDIPFLSRKVHLLKNKSGIEGEARALRYQVFNEMLAPQEALVTAHHQDDQCETFLLALKRGSGPAGLSAMPKARLITGHWHLRPLLEVSRKKLEDYAQAHQLSWIEDESNQDDRYDRNFLRLQILPKLEHRWPQFVRSVSRSAELCAEQETLLDELLATELESCVAADGSIDIHSLANGSEQKRNALLRRWFSICGVRSPSRQVLANLWTEVAMSRQDACPQLVIEHGCVRRYQQRLYYGRLFPQLRGTVLSWSGTLPALRLPNDLGILRLVSDESIGVQLRLPTREEEVTVRFGQVAHLHLVGRQGGRSLKKIWQEKGIPTWLRERIPLIYYNQQLMCAPGVFIAQEAVASKEDKCCVEWQQIDPELKPWIRFSSDGKTSFQ